MGGEIVAIVAIGCATGLLATLLRTIQNIATQRGTKADERILNELASLREEVRQLRQVNNDLVLSLDSHADRFTSRSVPSDTQTSAQTSEPQILGRTR